MEEIEQLKQQLKDQEKLASLGLLVAGIAHEVQNPLNFVLNFSKMSESLLNDIEDIVRSSADKLDKDEVSELEDISRDLKENMQKIQEHGERALNLVRGILLQSRGKAGEFLPTDMKQLVHEYVWLSYHAMRAKDKTFNLSIVETYPDEMPKVMVIPQDISRAVLNVMNNACYTVREKAGKGEEGYKPTIEINLDYTPSGFGKCEVRIDIKDNGMGMSDEVRERVFDNFFTTKPVGSGTGLGMGIIKSIVTESHNGRLELDTVEGLGTTVSFIFPAQTVR